MARERREDGGKMKEKSSSVVMPAWLAPSVRLSLSSAAGREEVAECCRELEEGHRAWAAHKKEAAWRLSRVELQMESEKACRRRELMEELEAKLKALRDEHHAALDRIDADYRDQLAGFRRDADAKEQKLADQWAARHARLAAFLSTTSSHS